MTVDPAPMRRAERKRVEQAAEMREDIIEAAFAEFSERGYHQTAMSHIAARLGVSQGTLYNYFDNKRDILERVIDDLLARVMEALGDENAPGEPSTLEEYREQTRRIAGAVDRIVDADPRVLKLLIFEATSIDAEMTERLLGLFDLAGQVGAAYLRNGVEQGFFRDDLDIAGTADAITGMVLAIAIRSLHSGLGAEQRAGLHEAVGRLLLDGSRAD